MMAPLLRHIFAARSVGHLFRYATLLAFSVVAFHSRTVSEAAGHGSPKLCDSTYQPMYCRCNVEEGDGEDPTEVQCFITAQFATDEAFLKVFEGRASVESLGFTTYGSGTHKMDFVPTDTLSKMPGLEKLKFSQMNLGKLGKRAFYNLSRLVVLSLDSNEITALDKEAVSHLPRLRKLEIADNNLTALAAGVLTELPSLTHLYLEKNQITTIEDMAFVHLSSLSELDLSDNAIENLTEGTFKGLAQLTRLDLFRNKVRRLGARVFGGAPMLAELDLKYNSIDEVDPLAFDGLPQLAILYLSYNRLRVLPANMFLGAPNLRTVDLSQNKLVTLTWRTLQDLVNIDALSFDLSLTGNQFGCDCRLAWMLHLENITHSDKFRRELRHVKCDFDATDTGPTAKPGVGSSKVARLSLKQLGCREDYEHPRLRATHTASFPSPSFPAPGSHDYDDDDDDPRITLVGILDDRTTKEGSTTDGDQDMVEASLLPTVALPASDTQGEGEAVGEDLSRSDHSSNNDIDTVLSQQKALDKSEPARKNKPRPAGVNSAALHISPASSCVGIMATSLIALAMSTDR
ncbi:uncharacterized protein [Dermacentor andersoni]|uniref:uncharacterized protein n=1 Tax=Dermacentor andersoni TaxID=34620 RepID=UPI0021556AD3|nr:insulin-like growth factor-binding protein complex acid labile subunit [Dermacentor andersoni]